MFLRNIVERIRRSTSFLNSVDETDFLLVPCNREMQKPTRVGLFHFRMMLRAFPMPATDRVAEHLLRERLRRVGIIHPLSPYSSRYALLAAVGVIARALLVELVKRLDECGYQIVFVALDCCHEVRKANQARLILRISSATTSLSSVLAHAFESSERLN
jgi:hypothetical protein